MSRGERHESSGLETRNQKSALRRRLPFPVRLPVDYGSSQNVVRPEIGAHQQATAPGQGVRGVSARLSCAAAQHGDALGAGSGLGHQLADLAVHPKRTLRVVSAEQADRPSTPHGNSHDDAAFFNPGYGSSPTCSTAPSRSTTQTDVLGSDRSSPMKMKHPPKPPISWFIQPDSKLSGPDRITAADRIAEPRY